MPVPALVSRNGASGIAAIRFVALSATYRVPLLPSPTPVGPTTSAGIR